MSPPTSSAMEVHLMNKLKIYQRFEVSLKAGNTELWLKYERYKRLDPVQVLVKVLCLIWSLPI